MMFCSPACWATGTTWFARTSTCNISAFTSYYSTVWNDKADGSGNWMGNGTSSTFANTIAAADILSANGQTGLTMDVDFTCVRISTAVETPLQGGSNGAAGGTFLVAPTDNTTRTVTANVKSGTTECLYATHTTGNYLILNGAINGGTTNSKIGLHLAYSGATTVNIGPITAGTGTSSFGVRLESTPTLTVNCDVSATTSAETPAIYNTSSTPVTITGSIINTLTSVAVFGRTIWNPSDTTKYIKYAAPSSAVLYAGLTVPAASILTTGTPTGAAVPAAGTYHAPDVAEVVSTATFGAGSTTTGTVAVPAAAQVLYNVTFGAGSTTTGTASMPNTGSGSATGDAALVLNTAHFGTANATAGTYYRPNLDSNAGVYTTAAVLNTAHFGDANGVAGTGTGGIDPANIVEAQYVLTGHYRYNTTGAGTLTFPALSYVLSTVSGWGIGGTGYTGTATIPLARKVYRGTVYGVGGNGSRGTLAPAKGGGK